MTTTNLIDMASGFHWFKENKIQITPGEVKAAGTLAQSELCSLLEICEARTTLALVAGTEEYTLPEQVINIKGERILFVSGETKRPIKKRTIQEVDYNRGQFASGNVQFFYTRQETSMVIGFQGIPDVAASIQYTYYRRPIAADALTDSVNPIISADYDMILYWFTIKQLVEIYKDQPNGERKLEFVKRTCDEKRIEAMMMKMKKGFTAEMQYEGIRF